MKKKIIFTQKEIGRIEKLAGKGLSIARIAGAISVSKSTLDRRIRENDKVRLAIEKGRSNSLEAVASTAYRMAISGKYPAMTIHWLKCMDKEIWNDKFNNEFVDTELEWIED